MCTLLYGSGLRLPEALQLRVKDVDFGAGEIRVRRAKGAKNRVTVLPEAAAPELQRHLERVRRLHERDLARGAGKAPLPDATSERRQVRPTTGYGSTSSRRRVAISILRATTGDIICMSRRFNGRFAPRRSPPRSRSG